MESENVSKRNQLINTKPEVNREDGKLLLEGNDPGLSSCSCSPSSSLEFGNGVRDDSLPNPSKKELFHQNQNPYHH